MWKAWDVLGTGRTVGIGVALMLVAGCGTSNTRSIPGGVASGAGFSVQLAPGWRAFNQATRNKIVGESQQQARAKGIPVNGVLEAGHWINPTSKGNESLVVDVEPVTVDTSDATVQQEQDSALQRAGATDIRQLSGHPSIDGVHATSVAYHLEGFDGRAISARRGPYLYSITVGAKAGQADVDSLVGAVVKAWRWTTIAVPALAQLQRYSGRGYKLILPAGWKAHGSADAELAGLKGADSVWNGYDGSDGQSVAAVWVRPAGSASFEQLVARELKNGGKRAVNEKLGNVAAAVIDISAHGNHLHEWLALRGGRVYAIVVRTSAARRAVDDAAVRKALDTWQFTG